MPHATPTRRPSPAALAKPGRRPPARRVVVIRQRHGIVLIFVVVLLTLLAIMGTAYLATSRLDRQAITGRGALPGANTPLLPDQRQLELVASGVEEGVKAVLIKDLFNQPYSRRIDSVEFGNEAFGAFRRPTNADDLVGLPARPVSSYNNYDAPGRSDPWLSSLLPARLPTAGLYAWPWIGRPLGAAVGDGLYVEPFFSDPRRIDDTGFSSVTTQQQFARFDPNPTVFPGGTPAELTERNDVTIGWVEMLRDATTTPRQPAWDNTRVYPAMVPGGPGGPSTPTAANTLIAGDADGDGIADGGLMPIALNPTLPLTSIDRYLDRKNGVVYFAAYRVVDNSAKLNLATALTSRGDVADMAILASGANGNADGATNELRRYLANDPTATPTPPPGTFGPNYGFFRANVGLVELIRGMLAPINQAADTAGFNPAQAELRRFVDARLPLLVQNPGANYDVASDVTNGYDVEKLALTFGKLDILPMRFGTSDTVAAASTRLFQYRSLGDLLEQQSARRPGSPGSYIWAEGASVLSLPNNALAWLGAGNATSLAAKGGTLVNPLISSGSAEDALMFSTRLAAPNVNNNGETPWGWFPPSAVALWFGWTQDFEPTAATTPPVIQAIDATPVQGRAFDYSFNTGGTPNPNQLDKDAAGDVASKPGGTANVMMPRSMRTLLTTYNGVTSGAPQRGDQAVDATGGGPTPTPRVPLGMPAYTSDSTRTGTRAIAALPIGGTDPSAAFWYPPIKVSAATGTKEQLWRAYWSAMTQQVPFKYVVGSGLVVPSSFWDAARPIRSGLATTYEPNQHFMAFRTPDRWASAEGLPVADPARPYLAFNPPLVPRNEQQRPSQTLSPRQMALLRSAVAACNTIDLRDEDNDLSAMDVDVTDDNRVAPDPVSPYRLYARVYGTEKQLVISAVYMEDKDGVGTSTPGSDAGYVAVEIYNPNDVPVRLDGYRLTTVNRPPPAANPLTGGVIVATPSPAGGAPLSIPLATAVGDELAPGGHVIIETFDTGVAPVGGTGPYLYDSSTVADPANRGVRIGADNHAAYTPGGGVPQLYRYNLTAPGPMTPPMFDTLRELLTGPRERELVLTRTRRNDGVAFVDATATAAGVPRADIENEDLTSPTTLATVDAVDVRLAVADVGGSTITPVRFLYKRGTPTIEGLNPRGAGTELGGAAPRDGAWRCFYAGRFYDLRPAASATARVPGTSALALSTGEWAWRPLTVAVTATKVELGSAAARTHQAAANTEDDVLLAPAIPIQNFAPYDPYAPRGTRAAQIAAAVPADRRGMFHDLNKFPYGSPFARDGDLMSVPYIGTYKIYRQTGAVLALYEYVPLPMDAWAVAPDPTGIAETATQIKTIGRFDPRDGAGGAPPFDAVLNEWAAALTDFVSARQAPYKTYFPDVPNATIETTFFDVSGTNNADNRYAQDGPVTGSDLAGNADANVLYTGILGRDNNPDTTIPVATRDGLRRGQLVASSNAATLIQGVVNVNTAPQIVLRQLPWFVNPANGQADPAVVDNRMFVSLFNGERDTRDKVAWNPATEPWRPFGFKSVVGLGQEPALEADLATAVVSVVPDELMRLGVLNPIGRNENEGDYLLGTLNASRVSNLASTRSDAFTVYVTVQAWTYVGGGDGNNAQAMNTRLVGERRSSFIVDRSRINQTNFRTSDLVVLPVERE